MTAQKKKKKYRLFWFFVKMQMVLLVLVVAAASWYFFGGYAKEVGDLQKEAIQYVRTSSVDTFKASQTSIVYAADGSVISTLKGGKESYYLTLDQMPVDTVSAIVSIEDKKFFRHKGIDYRAILRAIKAMIQNGEAKQGGSTITMQLARNIFLTQEKTWQRKIEEMFIATELEKKYTKEQILEFYLNNIYFGNGYYGIQSASRGYFNREVQELDLSQIAFVCAIPNNPTLYDPLVNMDNTVGRRDRILKNMLDDGKISSVNYAKAVAEEIYLERPEALAKNDYVETYTYYCATRALMAQQGFVFKYQFDSDVEEDSYDHLYDELYAECQKKLYTAGYRIYTSLDLSLQELLQASVDGTLSGYKDTNEEGVYKLQASAVCIDNNNGYVKAIVGGRSQEFSGYTLNRAYQSYRQPGSAIKPLIVYTPSFERNYTPDSVVVDEPIEDGPKNSNGAYIGQLTVRSAVEQSVNTIAWKLYEELTPEAGLSYLEKMNFSRLDVEDYRPATALGGFTNGVSALEMTAGYAAIENDGKFRAPTCIVKILDAEENEIYASGQTEKEIYKQNAARMMTDVLTGVLKNGTGRGRALSMMPSAGKTGTTNDQKDGWFAGYTRYYTTGVWVGYDMPQKLDGLMGSTYPGTIWQDFMEKIHTGLDPLEFLPYVKMSDSTHILRPSGEENAEDAVDAPEEGAAENGTVDTPQTPEDEAADTPQTPEDGTTDTPQTPENGTVDTPQTPEDGTVDTPQTPEDGTVDTPQTPENEPADTPQPPETPENGTTDTP